MASVDGDSVVRTIFFALTGTTSTDIYTIGDENESAAWLLSVAVVDPTGSVSTTAKIGVYRNPTEFRLSPNATGKPSTTDNLEIKGAPVVVMKKDDELRVTGASGHHVTATFRLFGVEGGSEAQYWYRGPRAGNT